MTNEGKQKYIEDEIFQKFIDAGLLVLTGSFTITLEPVKENGKIVKDKKGKPLTKRQKHPKFQIKTTHKEDKPHQFLIKHNGQFPNSQEDMPRMTVGTDANWLKPDNLIAMMMGHEYMPSRFIILVDVDNKEENGKLNGFKLWDKLKAIDKTIEDTPSELTPNKGKHFYYYLTPEMAKYMQKCSENGLTYEGIQYGIDIKMWNQPSFCAPSQRNEGARVCKYEWIGKPIYERVNEIKQLPDIIFNLFRMSDDDYTELCTNEAFKSMRKNGASSKTGVLHAPSGEACETVNIETLSEIMKYIPCPSTWKEWSCIQCAMKNVNENAYNLFDDWSRSGKNYGGKYSTIGRWNSHAPEYLRLSYLFHCMKEANKEGHQAVIDKIKRNISKKLTEDSPAKRPRCVYGPEKVELNQKFLSSPDGKIHNDADASEMDKIVTEWITGDTKFLSIRSPYGTGKTTLISNCLETFGKTNMQKVLYICYRRSLCRNIAHVLKKYDFVNYLEGGWEAYNGKRQIIQLDSLCMCGDDYDMIIFDESESLLRHLTSKTINSKSVTKSQMIYNDLRRKIHKAGKILVLDGDYDIRSNEFIKSFDSKYKVVINKFQPDHKIFELYHKRDRVDDLLIKDITANKKIVIVCMAAKDVIFYDAYLKEKFPTKKVLSYTSKSDDAQKNYHMANPSTEMNADVLIYSPVIESGVDINIEYDALYIMYSTGSVAVYGLSQMMARVRRYKSNVVRMCISGISMGNASEVIGFDSMIENYKYIMCKNELDAYDMVVCFNEYEESASNTDFLGVFREIMEEKGHEIKIIGEPKLKYEEDQKEYDECKKNGWDIGDEDAWERDDPDPIIYNVKHENYEKQNLLNAKDISKQEYDILNKKKIKGASTTEKYDMERYSYAEAYGIWHTRGTTRKETDEVINMFYGNKNMLYNHFVLLDNRNHADYSETVNVKGKNLCEIWNVFDLINDDPHKIQICMTNFGIKKDIIKVTVVRRILSEMGFKDCYDAEIKYNVFDNENKMPIFLKLVKLYGEANAADIKIKSKKSLVRYIKNILFKYGIVLHIDTFCNEYDGDYITRREYSIRTYEDLLKYAKMVAKKKMIYGMNEKTPIINDFEILRLGPDLRFSEAFPICDNIKTTQKESEPVPLDVSDDFAGFTICGGESREVSASIVEEEEQCDEEDDICESDEEQEDNKCYESEESDHEDTEPERPQEFAKSARGAVARSIVTEGGKVRISFW